MLRRCTTTVPPHARHILDRFVCDLVVRLLRCSSTGSLVKHRDAAAAKPPPCINRNRRLALLYCRHAESQFASETRRTIPPQTKRKHKNEDFRSSSHDGCLVYFSGTVSLCTCGAFSCVESWRAVCVMVLDHRFRIGVDRLPSSGPLVWLLSSAFSSPRGYHALGRTRPSRRGFKRTPSWAGSLSLGRSELFHSHAKLSDYDFSALRYFDCVRRSLRPPVRRRHH